LKQLFKDIPDRLGYLVKSKNICRIKGSANSKALLLLSHYDSAPHSFSRGASDAGSGVATILESVLFI
jgi:Zn-dependent M28 family amino/carboxypeptidase